jgi:acylphosphatase
VRNRRDGAVESLLAGPPPAVAAMIDRCWKGPRLANVQSIDVADATLLDLGHCRPGEAFSLIATE